MNKEKLGKIFKISDISGPERTFEKALVKCLGIKSGEMIIVSLDKPPSDHQLRTSGKSFAEQVYPVCIYLKMIKNPSNGYLMVVTGNNFGQIIPPREFLE